MSKLYWTPYPPVTLGLVCFFGKRTPEWWEEQRQIYWRAKRRNIPRLLYELAEQQRPLEVLVGSEEYAEQIRQQSPTSVSVVVDERIPQREIRILSYHTEEKMRAERDRRGRE